MKKIFGLYVLTLFVTSFGMAQNYGNEWIDFNKTYLKITLAQDGIYRISRTDLINAQFPIDGVDPRRLQLFRNGEEIAIRVEGQNDAVFNNSDFIEFYGARNDGQSDSRLYRPESAQPHTRYNIYSDTSAYFLTFNLTPVNGKRMTSFSENNVTSIPAQTSHDAKSLELITTTYSLGQSFNTLDVTQHSYFDLAEGWMSPQFQENESLDLLLENIDNAVQADGNPRLSVLLVGRDDVNHRVRVSAGANAASLREIGITTFVEYEARLFEADILWTDVAANGSILVRITALGVAGGNDRISVGFAEVTFPQAYDMQNAVSTTFNVKSDPTNKSFLEITNTPVNPQIYDITDQANVIRIGSNDLSGSINSIIDNTISGRIIYVNGPRFNTPVLSRVNFERIDPTSANYIIISHALLRQPVSGVNDPVQAYANYRESEAGGGFNSLIVNMDQLYNQFNFGMVSPLAIFDFMRFMVDQGNPEYLFLIGKGLEPRFNFHRDADGFIPARGFQMRDLVPPAGSPGSDMLYTAGLNGTNIEPAVPVGRLPAVEPRQVLTYLNKVTESEALPFDNLWRKRLLHLSGGISANELVLFRSFMDGFAALAESEFLGGDVITVDKNSTEIVSLINIADEVNEGLNLITFFGHSAPAVTDIDIGFVTDPTLGYNNAGRYPTILINGCNAGQFFNADVLFGEDWILAEDRGALAVIAHSSFGFTSTLRRYTDLFYSFGYSNDEFINKPIADIQKEVAREYISQVGTSPGNVAQAQQMVLLGDPAIRLFAADKPDYEINDDNIFIESFNEQPITAEIDSFALKLIVNNFGRFERDSVRVEVRRTLSDNTSITYDSLFKSVFFQDTLTLVINNENQNAFGSNQFFVSIDPADSIDELNEGNNTASFDFFIQLFGTQNLYPVNFSIVNSQPVEFLVQSNNLLEPERNFSIQLDTVDTFNSPFLKQNTISSKLLASWTTELLPNTTANDSTVYFWRSRFTDVQSGENDEWVTSSFIYINNGGEGWSQSVFDQYNDNVLLGLDRNEDLEALNFLTTTTDVFVSTRGSTAPDTLIRSFKVNGVEFLLNNSTACRVNTVNLVAFDSETSLPYAALPLPFQSSQKICGRSPLIINNFRVAEFESGTDNLLDYIDAVGDGDSVLLFTLGNAGFSSWSTNVKSRLGDIGVSSAVIGELTNGEPLIIFGRKGTSAGEALIVRPSTLPVTEQTVEVERTITGVFANGSMTSSIIGPARKWQTLISDISISESPQTDNFGVDIIGISLSGEETLLQSNVAVSTFDLSTISASSFPFLRLRYNTSDPQNLTPSIINKWQVIYESVPEGIIISDLDLTNNPESQEGQDVILNFGFKNISQKMFTDSLEVEYSIFNQQTRSNTANTFKINAPLPGDTTDFAINIDTRNKTGPNNFNLFVNPRIEPEQYYDNNLLDLNGLVQVNGDQINPIIDVVFDGEYILDGDIVSPSPLISIKLRDENEFLFKTDTVGFNVFLKMDCDGCSFERVPFTSNEIEWTPASEGNDFRVLYKPENLEDGIYTLRIDAADASGNEIGQEPYSINFEVINESTITNFYPYPNPFSTSTRFVFTLTGSEIPDQIKIQIMTVSGKVVREITQDELGAIRIGNNLTDYAWDGKDEFGDQLANGVYLYRVIIRTGGETIDHRDTSADKAFKNGFGKLYLLR